MQRPRQQPSAFSSIRDELKARILKDEFPPDSPLPTEEMLAVHYSVSRQTIRRAFQDLVAAGLVTRTPGRGTFATPRPKRYLRQVGSVEDLMALSADSQLQLISPLANRVDPAASGRLQLAQDHVVSATFLRLHEGSPFSQTCVYMPPAVAAHLENVPELNVMGTRSRITVIGLLDRALEEPIDEAVQSITIALATPQVAENLNIAEATPVLRIDRTYHTSTGTPVELAISYFHPERYSYRVRLRRGLA